MDLVYTLVFWIAGCYGPECVIPTYEVKYYDNIIECEETAQVWRMAGKDNHAACVKGKVVELEYHKERK